MRNFQDKFVYCRVVLATSLIWVLLDTFLLLYFSECNKCDEKNERGLPARNVLQPVYPDNLPTQVW
uniref:Uncharacterized protein n=1 Tax=Marmota marmota marmota TaxID=9994 RepID=A0A8C5YQB2_MARMA